MAGLGGYNNTPEMTIQQVRIVTCDPSTNRIEGVLKDGGIINIAVWDVPPVFAWPKEGENWTIYSRGRGLYWTLGSRVENSTTETLPITDLNPGEARLGAETIYDRAGKQLVSTDSSSEGFVPVWHSGQWVAQAIVGGGGGGGTAITAGAGLTLTGSTLNVGGSTTISVAADTIQVANASIGSTQLAASVVATPFGTAIDATPALRALGTSAGQALPGNDPSVTNARIPTGTAGGDLTGSTYPNPTIRSGVQLTGAPTLATPPITPDNSSKIATTSFVMSAIGAGGSYQPLDATLTALAAFNSNGMISQTAADTFAARTITGNTEIVVTNGDGIAGNPTLSIGSAIARTASVQPLDATLTALAAFNANGLLTQTATDTFVSRSIIGDTEAVVTNGSGVGGNPTLSIGSGIARLASPTFTGTVTTPALAISGSGKTMLTLADTGAQNSGFTIGGDTTLYRVGIGVLQTDGLLRSIQALATSGAFNARVTGDLVGRIQIGADGSIAFGDGTNTRTTFLSRTSTGQFKLQTDTTTVSPGNTLGILRNLDPTGFAGWQFNDQDDIGRAFVGWSNNATTANQYLRINSGTNPLRLMYDGTDVIRVDNGPSLGFFNVTPITKPVATNDLKASLVSLGLITGGGATPLNLGGGAMVAGGGYSLGAALSGTPAYQSQQVAAQTVLRNKLLAADANDTFHILGSGMHEWGPGGATAVDTNLYREFAGALHMNGEFRVDTYLYAQMATANQVTIGARAGSTPAAGLAFGLSLDTNLYRGSTGVLKTDTQFQAGTALVANVIATANLVVVGATAAGVPGPGLSFGSGQDASIARTAAGELTFNGSPRAPTPAASDNSTKLATTAYTNTGPVVKRARAYRSAALSPTSGSWQKVALDATEFDNDTMFDSTNGRLVCKTAGVFNIAAQLEYTGSATGSNRIVAILVNGALRASQMGPIAGAGGVVRMNCAVSGYPLAVNDTIELYTYQDSSAGLALNLTENPTGSASSNAVWLTAVRVGSS